MGTQHLSRLRALVVFGLALLLGGGWLLGGEGAAEPQGRMVLAVDFAIAPSWFDPGEAPAIGTPYIFLYALHDALIKPLPGNASTRIEELAVSGGYYAYEGHPDVDELFQQQALERDRQKREVLLHEIQRRIAERVMFAPMMQPAVVHAVGPRVAEAAIGITPLAFYPVPYEDMRLKE